MKIVKLILFKYKRLFLSNIEKIEYTPESNLQVILGRNMSGKSSLLKELSPLPADLKKEFKDTGYKEIHIENNDSYYILKSSINNDKVCHSFIKDNTELNKSGNKRIQLELVKQYFNLTPDIFSVILNTSKFTNMSPFERKHWFSQMATIDYSYSINIYNKIKSNLRDIIGGIKLTNETIINTENKLKDTTLFNKYKKDKEVLENIKEHIISLYIQQDDKTINIETILDNITNISNSILTIKSKLDTNLTKQQIESNITILKTKLEANKHQIEKTTKELRLLEKSKEYGEESKLKSELSELQNKYNALLQDITSTLNTQESIDPSRLHQDYLDYSNANLDIVSNLNELSEYDTYIKYKQDNILKLKEELTNSSNSILRLTKHNTLLQEEINNINKYKSEDNLISCNQCGNTWYYKYDKNKLESLTKQIETNTKSISSLETKVKDLSSLLEKIHTRLTILDNIKNIIRSYPTLKYIWISILKSIDINNSTTESMLSEFNKYLLYLNNWKDITPYHNSIKDIQDKLKYLQDIKLMNISVLEDRFKILNEQLHDLNNNNQQLSDNLRLQESYLRNLIKLEEHYKSLHALLFSIKDIYNHISIDIRNKHLNEVLLDIKDKLMFIDNELSSIKSLQDNLDKNKELISSYKIKEKVLKILEKELSPTEGLIAKSINSFLNIFIEEMNYVISNIWTYGLELLPCDIDTESGIDLDYKFRVKVNNSEIIEDVSKLSSSGQEIVNLAYRLVFSKYISLPNIPLYLDEFSSSMDTAHRAKSYEVIDKILSSEYGQIFIICHYSDLYSSLRNVDFNILDPNNIDTTYIKHNSTRFKINS